ncbi:GNAT family N-acetyltransferase [Sinomicrobium weinanense]|uniref:GNAT family N-acetyltransferase n=1 Tax=Sinomicrobium weinanense TaxID=2842200 RepID=A0A926Q2M6_9FLAO|nr:GNAT family N-acetyltransferase [Sinomicrobium weinanense]MBC9796688.1 GNAT family N-acetyltransferase [Sinomicrobium weinanense]MBU3123037.1 GNAT family N-acetyltransferase [Sinomicrobium weinanense]
MKTQENINITKANIENLTSLWATVSSPFKSYHTNGFFDYATVPDSDWPNRLWFNRDITEHTVKDILNILKSSQVKLTVPYWDIYDSRSYELLESEGFTQIFEQVGMSLPLTTHFPQADRLDIRPVSNRDEASAWATLYPKAFGYRIGENILLHTGKEVSYFLVCFQDQPIGTAIIHYTGRVAGIHGVGVIPEMRRKGFAEEIMRFTLNKAIDAGAQYATLQASAMGKGLYDKLGFTEQFVMKNYTLV